MLAFPVWAYPNVANKTVLRLSVEYRDRFRPGEYAAISSSSEGNAVPVSSEVKRVRRYRKTIAATLGIEPPLLSFVLHPLEGDGTYTDFISTMAGVDDGEDEGKEPEFGRGNELGRGGAGAGAEILDHCRHGRWSQGLWGLGVYPALPLKAEEMEKEAAFVDWR
ncbi:hypothetical protein MKZ38_003920 [Zalerion maritima]|uniref:Uncharacterized protein n=1 Tax=Zalerion maritima TaxID=339359 RepID=A0AAD5RMB0_9PEZI|nr:hypothetical protein MKZ38_003920 [Zalerion maritima]